MVGAGLKVKVVAIDVLHASFTHEPFTASFFSLSTKLLKN